jgi:DNA-binding beta-propeller fold protein YncE
VNLTADDRWLFLSDESTGTISVVDLVKARQTHFHASAVVGQIPVGRAPIALTFSADQRLLYTTSQIVPETYGWPPVCSAPGSDTLRQRVKYAKGAILVIDVARAAQDPGKAVVGAMAAGCNPVRLATSPRGDVAYVNARTDNALLAFDTGKLLTDTANALIARVPVGVNPVGLIVLREGAWVVATNSNRFGDPTIPQSLVVIDAHNLKSDSAVLGTIPAGIFPRELRVTNDQRTLLLTNFVSKNVAVIDIARMQPTPPKAGNR